MTLYALETKRLFFKIKNPPIFGGFLKIRKLFLEKISDFCEEVFLCWTLWSFWSWSSWFLKFCHRFDDKENTKCDDKKINRWLCKITPIKCHFWYTLLHSWDFFDCSSDDKFVVCEIHTSSQETNNGHNDIRDEWCHDFTKCATDNDSDSEIDDVTTHSKCFEFLDKWHKSKVKSKHNNSNQESWIASMQTKSLLYFVSNKIR